MEALFGRLTRSAPDATSSVSCSPASATNTAGLENTATNNLMTSLQLMVKRDETRRGEYWRPENRGALVPRGTTNSASLSGRLLYAATHVDRTQRRNIANLIAKERIYRQVFCDQDTIPRDTLDESLVNGDLSFIKYRDAKRDLTLERLCEHIEQLMERRYSLSYIFAYLSYLRRKYRTAYPKFGNQTSAFYRTLIDNYEQQARKHPRIGTDEVYTCEDSIYEAMYAIARAFFFSDMILRMLTSDKLIFTYVFLFMYYTGKRLSELALIGREQITTLLNFDALVIRIPKCKKLGRITLRGYDEQTLRDFKDFLRRALDLFSRVRLRKARSSADAVSNGAEAAQQQPTYHDIPFDQFSKRRILDRNFALLYESACRKLAIDQAKKPRGLSLHSLRRYRAASMFAAGKEIDHIRECLDHSSVKVTNTYINKHLMRSYRRKDGAGSASDAVDELKRALKNEAGSKDG